MPSPTPLWDPRQVLQISDDDRCIGYAPSRGRKCRNIIAGHNLFKADTLLKSIAQEDPDADVLRSKLRRLAEYLLCVRWHQPQARDMVDKWGERVKTAYPYGEVVELPRLRTSASSLRNISSNSLASSSPSVSSRRTTSSASSVSLPTHSGRESLEEIIANLQEMLRIQGLAVELNHPSSRSSTRTSHTTSHVSTSDTSSLDLSRSSNFLPSTSIRLQARTSTAFSSTSTTRPQARTSTASSSVSATRPQTQASTSSSAASTTRPQARTSTASSSMSATRPETPTSTSSSSTSATRPQTQTSTSSSSASAARPQARASTVSSSANPTRPQTRTSTSSSSVSATRLQTQTSTSSSTARATRPQVHTPTASSDRSADITIASSTSLTRSHIRQRAIDEECPICMQDFLSDDLIMWCKTGCGWNVHQNCFEKWQIQCVADGRSTTCTLCRAAWEDQNAVKVRESCTRTHVRRLDIDDECPICQEDYRADDSLVWCKDGCGRTVHRDCFQEWQAHLDNSETSATCAFCRKVWASDCECSR
jgi:hypothetical protein